MSVWFRVANNSKIPQVFSGDGGLYVAGRWNHKGFKAIYCSQSISLCTLEWLAHNGLSVSHFNYYKFSIEISDALILPFQLADLPEKWHETPTSHSSRDFAHKNLFDKNKYLALAIPSVMVPEEFNLVINPLHPAFQKAKETICFLGEFIAPQREKT